MSKVLIVEDEVVIAWDFMAILSREGYEVDHASSIEMALVAIHKFQPKAAVLDGYLRGRHAEPVARELESKKIPYVMCSAHQPTAFEGWAKPLLFLKKPCRTDELITAVRSVVEPTAGRGRWD